MCIIFSKIFNEKTCVKCYIVIQDAASVDIEHIPPPVEVHVKTVDKCSNEVVFDLETTGRGDSI